MATERKDIILHEEEPKIRIMSMPEGWEALAEVVAHRAEEINRRSGDAWDKNVDPWELAENQVEKPLMCGLVDREGGVRRVTLNSLSVGTKEIDISAEPHRLILLGWNKASSEKDRGEPAVRVLTLADEVEPSSLKVKRAGHILDIELDKAAPHSRVTAAAKTAA